MGYKRGTDDIDSPKVDGAGAGAIGGSIAVTANGERGTLTISFTGTWASTGAAGTIVFTNSKIKEDSCITLSLQNDVKSRLFVITSQASQAIIVPINYQTDVTGNPVVKINYRITN